MQQLMGRAEDGDEDEDEDVSAVFVAVWWCSNAVPPSRTWIYECYPALLAAQTELTWVAVWVAIVVGTGGGGTAHWGLGWAGRHVAYPVEKCSAAPCYVYRCTYLLDCLFRPRTPPPLYSTPELPWWNRA